MQRHESDGEEPLEDKTITLPLHSKRTDRMQRKRAVREKKRQAVTSIAHLPTELVLEILQLLQPHQVFNFAATCKRFASLVDANSGVIGNEIIKRRYPLLVQCFSLPTFLSQVDPNIQPLLLEPGRQAQLAIHQKPYQHVHPPDPQLICTCLTCILLWNNLNLALDFAHWQDNLDAGEPIPIPSRGETPEWGRILIKKHARIVRKALHNPIWHARILETHLDSTVRAIRRHCENKGNKRKHVDMTEEEAETGTDAFLSKSGPLSLEFPYRRDEYYMLFVSPLARAVRC